MADALHQPLLSEPALAKSPVDRQRLLAAMIDLCQANQGEASAEAQAMIDDIFLDLVTQAERDLRLRLAEQLASEPWAPSGLINALALDDIEIARPVIAKSPVLKDHDLIQLLVVATIDHQIEVARRPNLGEAVVKAIIDQGDPAVLTTLAGNETADICELSMERLVSFSREVAGLRPALARHPRLSLDLAQVLHRWVGETLKAELCGRFRIDEQVFDRALRTSVAEGVSGAPAPYPPNSDPDMRAMETRAMETKLIAKLQAAGELRPGFLLRALREGKLHLFQVALASLAETRTETVERACQHDCPELLALACASVGIDRSVFPSILSLVQGLNHARPASGPESLERINHAFSLQGAGEAAAAFRAGAAGR
jgi:uncharacterized protein (DUF2336 family)